MFLDIFYFLVNFFSYSALLNELVIVTRVVNLPLLEPLTTEKLNSLMAIGCSCMLVGSALADAQHQQLLQRNSAECSQEDREFDELAHNIADKCVKKIFSFFFFGKILCKNTIFLFLFLQISTFTSIVNLIEKSRQAGGMQAQNFRTMGAICLLVGIVGLVDQPVARKYFDKIA